MSKRDITQTGGNNQGLPGYAFNNETITQKKGWMIQPFLVFNA
jgi:hypothetical protein